MGTLLFLNSLLSDFHYHYKFLDYQIWAKSADPDQTAPSGAV